MLLYGESGVGKTYCTRTLLDAGFKVRFLAAENNAITGTEIAMNDWKKQHNKPISEEQYALMIPSRPKRTLQDLVTSQENFIKKSLDAQYKSADPKRKDYTRYLEVLKATVAFTDSRTGKVYGSVDDWGEDTVLIVDSLTILCEAIKQSVIGGKLAVSQPEWGVMQGILVEFLRQLTEDLNCNLVVIGHPVKEEDPVLGITRIYPANLGKALNNILPTYFTEVVWAFRDKKKFYWSTDHKQAVTRNTLLPIEERMEQDFRLLKQ